MRSDDHSLFENTLYKGPELIKGGRVHSIMLRDRSSFCYSTYESGKTVFYKVDPQQNTKDLFFDVERLRKTLQQNLNHDLQISGVPFTEFEFLNDDQSVSFVVEDHIFILQLRDYSITKKPLPAPPSEEELHRVTPRLFPWMLAENAMELKSPDGKWFLGVQDHNVYIRSIEDGRQIALTFDGSEAFTWDTMGAKWSLDGSKVAVKKVDLHEMTQIPIVHWLKPLEEVETMRWAGAPGQPLWHNELYVLDISSGEKKQIETGSEADPYLNIVGWLPDELIFCKVDREYKTLHLLAADPGTGKGGTILIEKQPNFHNYEVFGALPITPIRWKALPMDIRKRRVEPSIPVRSGWHTDQQADPGRILCFQSGHGGRECRLGLFYVSGGRPSL